MHPQGDPQAPDLFANLAQDTPMSQRVQPGLGGRPILPAELLIQRVHADEMVPCRLPLTDDTLTPATDLIALSRVAHGRTRGKLDAELQVLEGDQTDYRLKRGLAHLLTHDFSTFEVESPVEPPLLRQRVFALSASSIPSPQRTSETLAAVADALSQELTRDISAEQVRAWLYADRPDEQVLTTVDEPTPETLLTATTWRRPRACCTAPTRWCSRRTAMTPANKLLFRYLKLFGLRAYIEGDADHGFTLTIDGPASLFSPSPRYGMALAKLLPALLHVTHWQLTATLVPRQRSPSTTQGTRFTPGGRLQPRVALSPRVPLRQHPGAGPRRALGADANTLAAGARGGPDPAARQCHGAQLSAGASRRPEYLRKKFAQVRRAGG
jgi:hypothetical protein